jgi:hypothetical protein
MINLLDIPALARMLACKMIPSDQYPAHTHTHTSHRAKDLRQKTAAGKKTKDTKFIAYTLNT